MKENSAVERIVVSALAGMLGGGPFKLSDQRGRAVILDFWAAWCGPGRKTRPVLAALAKAYAGRGVRYFAVDWREEPKVVREYLTRVKLDLAVPLDRKGEVGTACKVRGIPKMILVDRHGIVREDHLGFNEHLRIQLQGKLDALVHDNN